jgi:hypothetical protein
MYKPGNKKRKEKSEKEERESAITKNYQKSLHSSISLQVQLIQIEGDLRPQM